MYVTISWRQAVCPFYESCPLLEASIITDSMYCSTLYVLLTITGRMCVI